ncbi:hypothetical protein ACH4E7_16570 [Kitasatospora sp. NPDC018058]
MFRPSPPSLSLADQSAFPAVSFAIAVVALGVVVVLRMPHRPDDTV